MRIIQKSILNFEGADYYIKHLQVINPFLPVQLSPKEMEVLGTFMSFHGELADKNRFCTSLRKEVKERLSGMSSAGLSNHLKSLLEKEAIYAEVDGSLVILPLLFPEENQQFYQFKITKKNGNQS